MEWTDVFVCVIADLLCKISEQMNNEWMGGMDLYSLKNNKHYKRECGVKALGD